MGNVTISATTANACGCCGGGVIENCCTAAYAYGGDTGSGSASGLTLFADTQIPGGAPGLTILWQIFVNIASPALLTFSFTYGGDGINFSRSIWLDDPNMNGVALNSGNTSYADFICNQTGCYFASIVLSGNRNPNEITELTTTTAISSNATIYCSTFAVSYAT